MSRYEGGRGDYRQSGGYNNGYRGYNGYGKINEDDVPESQHSIFVRGLPSSITFDEIKNFFEDNIGPCSFDFQKVNYERQSLFVAVRFDSKDHAKEAFDKYREQNILGCRCDVTWFRDIRRYISYQQQTGGTIRRGNFGRGGVNRYNNGRDFRKRRYSDDRRSRSRSYSDSDRSRSRSRRSSRSRSSRSRSRSEGERSTSRESGKRRSESKDEKRKKKEKKVKKTSKKERRSRRSESRSSRSDGERSRSSSRSDRDRSDSRKRNKHNRRADSPASSTGSPLRMTPPPPAPQPTIIGPLIPSATTPSVPPPSTTSTPIEKPAPLRMDEIFDDDIIEVEMSKMDKKERKKKRKEKKEEDRLMKITIANKTTVPVENTSFKMQLDTDEPPRKIVRGPISPEPKEVIDDDDAMEVEKEDEEEVPLRKENLVVDPKEKGGWRTVGDDNNSGPPSDVTLEVSSQNAPPPALIQPTLSSRVNGTPDKTAPNGFDMVPRSVGGPPAPSGSTPLPPPPKRLPPMGTPSSLPPPPPGRVSLGGGGIAAKYPEMGKIVREIKGMQDIFVNSIKPNALRLSDLGSGESISEKMGDREKQISELDPAGKSKFDLKIKQITTSFKGDANTITTVVKSVVQKDPSLEEQLKPALLAVLEDLEKQIYKKVDDFLLCGL